jgi:plasmid stabilization system protein ParE
MAYRVVIQPGAERDIRDAAHWISEQSKDTTAALRWARGIRAKIDTLKSTPSGVPSTLIPSRLALRSESCFSANETIIIKYDFLLIIRRFACWRSATRPRETSTTTTNHNEEVCIL